MFLSKITNSLDHFQHSKEEEGTVQRVTRIKAGELDLTGSEADPKKCFQLNNFIIYLLIILFAAFLVSNGIIGVQYLNRFQDQTDFVLQQANSTLLQS